MNTLDYQIPTRKIRTSVQRSWWPYFGGAFLAIAGGFSIWIVLCLVWPKWRWQILDIPSLPGAPVAAIFLMGVSATIYKFVAGSRTSAYCHRMLGIFAGVSMMAFTNFIQRRDDSRLADSSLLEPVYLSGILITPVFLGLLARRYATATASL